ncbi:MAG: hypothetical protein NTW87_34345, partial [Planctomycetota bacterium]|nr:hypothetical protein [Planctomycetota bacterium]
MITPLENPNGRTTREAQAAVTRRCILLLLSLSAVALLGAAEPDATAAARPVLLLTGFEPFGGLKVNASWETVKRFQGREILGHRIETVVLPVVYDEMAAPLEEALARHTPAAVISFGVGTPVVQVETVARNGYHRAKPPDNKGRPPPRREIVPDGAKELATALPVDAILSALSEAKIGAAKS